MTQIVYGLGMPQTPRADDDDDNDVRDLGDDDAFDAATLQLRELSPMRASAMVAPSGEDG